MLDLDNIINKQNERNNYEFVESMKNGNTKVKTKSDLKRVEEFLAGIVEHRTILDVQPEITYLLSSDIPGFYYDKEKKRYFKIAPGHSGNKITRETIAKKEAEEKRISDVEKLSTPKSVINQGSCRKKICFRNIVPLLDKVSINEISYDQMRSELFQSSVSALKPVGSQHLFDLHWLGTFDNLEHIQMMHVGQDHAELLGLWSLKETWVQRIQAIKLQEGVRTKERASLCVVANMHKKMITQSLNKVTDMCWAHVQSGRKHVLYTTICHTGYTTSLAMIRNIDMTGESGADTVLDYSLGKKATWACAWNTPKQLFSVGSEKCALILNVERRTMWEYSTNMSDPLTQVFSHETGNTLYTGTRKGEILSHDLRSRATFPVGCLPHKSSVCGLNLLQNDIHLLATDFTGRVCLWDLRKKSAVVHYHGNVNMYTRLPVHVDEKEKMVYTVGEDGYSRFWNLQQGNLLHTIPPPRPVTRDTIPSVKFSSRWGNRQGNFGLIMGLENKLYYYGTQAKWNQIIVEQFGSQIKPNVLLGLIWIQTVCKGYSAASMHRVR